MTFSFHLLDDLFQFFRHSGIGLAAQLHRAVRAFADDDVHLAGCGILVRKILAEMAAAAFLAVDGRARDGLGNREQMLQIDRGVPAGIVFAVAVDGDLVAARSQSFASPSSARTISSSRRTMPTRFCIMSCKSCCT